MGISPDALEALVAAGTAPPILDVRSRWEFRRGHVPGARHLPFWQVGWGRPGPEGLAAGRDGPLVTYCGHGPRAWVAGLVLRARGYRGVTCLDGHYARWRREGRPLTPAADARGRPRGTPEERDQRCP